MSPRNAAAVRQALGHIADDGRWAVPPNPLAPLIGSKRHCTVVTAEGPCPDFAGYIDTVSNESLCISHAKAVNDLPESVAKRQATVEMAMVTLTNMTAEAVTVLGRIMSDEEVPAGVRLKAATEVLDRTGLVKTSHVQISTPEVESTATASDAIRKRLERLAPSANVLVFPKSINGEDSSQD